MLSYNLRPRGNTPFKHMELGTVKTFTLESIITVGIPYLIAFFTPITPLLIGVGLFTIFDTFTGIWASVKRGNRIHSRAMARTITKMILYSTAIILAHLLEDIFMPWLAVTSITAGYIALVEFRSNMENIGFITKIDIWNYIKDKIDAFKPKEEGQGRYK